MIGEPTLWQIFFLVLKLSKESTVDLLYRAKEMKRILYYSDMRIPCNKNDQGGGATGTEEVWGRDEMVRGEVDRNKYTHNRSLRSGKSYRALNVGKTASASKPKLIGILGSSLASALASW